MKLYLMRHGQAASPQIDPQQGLSPAGRLEIEQLAQRLSTKGIQFAQVFHSEKARAQQTAEIMATTISPKAAPTLRTGLNPNDDPRPLIPEINDWQMDTLIVSHLPFVPSLLSQLSGDTSLMAVIPGTLICLHKNGDNWVVDWVETP